MTALPVSNRSASSAPLIGRRSFVYAAAAFVVAVQSLAASADAGKPAVGRWGFDLAAMDRSVEPGDDFFRYTGGTWMKTTEIPPDRAQWGSFDILLAKSEEDVRAVIETAARGPLAPGSVERKVVDYYRSYVDADRIERLRLDPVRKDLARIASLQTYDDVVRFAATPDFRATMPVGVYVALDASSA